MKFPFTKRIRTIAVPNFYWLRLLLPLISTGILTGCYTVTQEPGAVGRVVDAKTGAPIRGAHIGLEKIPCMGVISDKEGNFNLPPVTRTQIAFMYLHNPESISGSFVIAAKGYVTNKLSGVATSHGLWRVDLGEIILSKTLTNSQN